MSTAIHPEVAALWQTYPELARDRLNALRQLIYLTAAENREIGPITETLKWGEASYLSRQGSTLRIDWKASQAGQYAMYCHCQTCLIETFRELYADSLRFDGKRAVVLSLDEAPPVKILSHCISLALRYHQLKQLPLLGC